MQPITVLSLFDWMSCWRLALERAGIPVENYWACEIDKYATQVSRNNRDDVFHLWDVRDLSWWDFSEDVCWEPIDLLIGGSPCQWFSNAGKGLNFEDPRSKLFFEFVRILNEAKPRYFLLENVKMKKERQNTISEHLFGIQPVEIDSALVSAQRRKRLYWVGERSEDWSYSQVVVNQPEDKGIMLKDIIDYGIVDQDKSYCIDANYAKGGNLKSYARGRRQLVFNSIYQLPRGKNPGGVKEGKSPTLSSNSWQYNNFLIGNQYNQRIFTDKSWCLWTGMGRTNKQGMWVYNDSITPANFIRKLTPIECERLQTLPDNYTAGVSNSQRYKMLGNGWTVDVIAHIFREMFKD